MTSAAYLLAGALLLGAGEVEAAFEDIEVSPRTRSMGWAFAAIGPEAYTPFHNPASLGWTLTPEGGASYVRPFGYHFSGQVVASGIVPLGRLGGAGLGVRYFGVDYRDTFLTGEFTAALSHGFQVLNTLQSTVALGYTLNFYSLNYGTSVGSDPDGSQPGADPGSDNVFALNLAARASLYDRTRVGFYANNINNAKIGNVDKEDLIRRVGVGVSYKPYAGVETILDMSSELSELVQFRGGVEFEILEYLLLRAGLRTQPNIYTAGFGVRFRGLVFDYGFSTGGGSLATTHQFGLSYVVPEKKK